MLCLFGISNFSPSSLHVVISVKCTYSTYKPQYLLAPRLTRDPRPRHIHAALVETASVIVTCRC